MNDQQLLNFAEFSLFEKNVGGPDPHMKLAGGLVQDSDLASKWWMGGCYIGVYNFPTAEKLFEHWTLQSMRAAPMTQVVAWLDKYWAGIATRRERRAVRTPVQLARFLKEYASWAYDVQLGWGGDLYGSDHEANYESFWVSSQRVYSLGRYVALKLGEFLRRYAGVPIEMPDLRLRGGWSPMEGLALIFPEDAAQLQAGDRYADLGEARGAFAAELAEAACPGLELTRYEIQVLLCDYKQSWTGKRQYPGRSQDSELEYHAKIAPTWGSNTEMFRLREQLFPIQALGEHQGWEGVRKELGHFLRQTGGNWSDLRYDYKTLDPNTGHVMVRVAA